MSTFRSNLNSEIARSTLFNMYQLNISDFQIQLDKNLFLCFERTFDEVQGLVRKDFRIKISMISSIILRRPPRISRWQYKNCSHHFHQLLQRKIKRFYVEHYNLVKRQYFLLITFAIIIIELLSQLTAQRRQHPFHDSCRSFRWFLSAVLHLKFT